MRRGTRSRRGFLGASMAALVGGAGLPGWFAREVIAADESAPRNRKRIGPNDAVVIGAIGLGSRGLPLMDWALMQQGVRVAALCDVDAAHLAHAAAQLVPTRVAQFADYRDLLARPDIDAVTIATPDHSHARIAVAALKAGKDVYCEKPLTLTIDEGIVLNRVANAAGRVAQVGTQQRSDARFRLACELVRNGRLGALTRVETRIGANPVGGPYKPSTVPDGLDWDAWLGQTPLVPYLTERCHYNYRWWYEYSGGKVTDWGAHHNDIAQWALGADDSGPVAVAAVSDRVGDDPASFNCPADFTITYHYANRAQLVCSAKGSNGVKLEGERGHIFVNRERIAASDPKLLDEPLPRDALRLPVSNDHMQNFIDCVRDRKTPLCDPGIGHRSASVCHLGNIAIRLGRRLTWDPARERFVGDDAANAMLRRAARAPYGID